LNVSDKQTLTIFQLYFSHKSENHNPMKTKLKTTNNMRTAAITVLATSMLALSAQSQAAMLDDTKPPASVSANDFIELFGKLSGSYPGFRKAHARGACAAGTFVPNKDAKEFSDSALFSSGDLPTVMRFSLGGANPNSDERVPGVRGLGIQIALPDGSKHGITGNSNPVFGGKDPETFFGFLTTLLPDESGKPNMAKVGAYVAANPSVQANAMWSRTTPAPASWANTPYFGLHTFFYQPQTGEQLKYRWALSPDLGNVGLTAEQAATMPAAFLEEKLTAQVNDPATTVSFTLSATIGEAQDTNIDPSMPWPDTRQQVVMGTITVNAVGGESCKNVNFDPNLLSKGFTPSDDPILRMRSPAYGISFGKRLSGQ
jgi:catalase